MAVKISKILDGQAADKPLRPIRTALRLDGRSETSFFVIGYFR